MIDRCAELPEVVLFDVGGTLVELSNEPMTAIFARTLDPPVGEEALQNAFETVLSAERHGRAPRSADEFVRQWSRDYRLVLEAAGYGGDIERGVDDMWRIWVEPGTVCPEVPDVLRTLLDRGHRLGVVSNWAPRLDDALVWLGIEHFFEVVICSSLVGSRKPDPAIFNAALAGLGVEPSRCAYVGDSIDADVEGASRVGMMPILVARSSVADVQPGALDSLGCRVITSLTELVD